VDGDCGEILFDEELRQRDAALHTFHENDHLVELEDVEQLKQLAVLFRILELDIMLLEAVEGKLSLVVNIHLHGLKERKRKRLCHASSYNGKTNFWSNTSGGREGEPARCKKALIAIRKLLKTFSR
jgi:hypothetical protein